MKQLYGWPEEGVKGRVINIHEKFNGAEVIFLTGGEYIVRREGKTIKYPCDQNGLPEDSELRQKYL